MLTLMAWTTGMRCVYHSMSTSSLSNPESTRKTTRRRVSMTARLLRRLVKVEGTDHQPCSRISSQRKKEGGEAREMVAESRKRKKL